MSITKLLEKFSTQPWFHSIDEDQFGRIVIYTKYNNDKILSEVPYIWDDKQVLTHFAAYKEASQDRYITSLINPLVSIREEIEWCLAYCSADDIIDLLYEIHENEEPSALGKKYPLIKKTVQKLYDEYGFDVILDEILEISE